MDILDNVKIELSGNLLIAGLVDIYGAVVVTGEGQTLEFDSGTITQMANSIFYFDVGTTWDVDGVGTYAGNAASTIHFNGCTIDMTDAGFTVDAGYAIFENKVTINGENTLNISTASTKVLGGARVILANGADLNVG